MTDLISSLADSIIALINSKPASPTKEEVESVLLKFPALLAARVRKPDAKEVGWAQTEARKLGLIDACQGEAPSLITREKFITATGREPQDDDLERCNCASSDMATHSCCGWNEEHDKPQFMVGPRFK